MQTVKTDTFSLEIADVFESVRVAWQSVRAEHEVDDDAVMITVGLADDGLLRKRVGVTLAERFRAWCAERRGRAELLEERAIDVDGRESRVVTALNETGYAFYFAVVPIGDGMQVDFTGDCLAGQEAQYFPLFEQALLSLRTFGDPAAALAAQRQALDAMFARTQPPPAAEPLPAAPPFAIPADGTEFLTIAGHALDCSAPVECTISRIPETGSALTVEIKARAQGDAACGQALNDYEDGHIYLRVSLSGVYRAGVPTGRFHFEQDRDTAGVAYLWKGGFRYDLALRGELVLEDGWVGFSGWLENDSGSEHHSVACARRLPLQDLDWTHYRFTSMEELLGAPAGLPRHLKLTDPELAVLPPELYEVKSLQSLDISYTSPDRGAEGLREISCDLARLRELRSLALHGVAAVREIPLELGELRALRWLSIAGSQAVSVPPEVLSMPGLEYCSLAHNRLEHVPAAVTSTLASLSLEDNRLTGLPDTLARLPGLKYLNIQSNPLASLPAGLEGIPGLKLEIDKKLSLLDYSYRGADGSGAAPFDEARFLARGDPQLVRQLDEAMAGEAWAPYRDGVHGLALRAVALATTGPDDYGRVGNTRFGGLPDLPSGVDYPTWNDHEGEARRFRFVAQLNCAGLAPLQDYLPRSGMLYFFIADEETFRPCVIHHDGDVASLLSAGTLDVGTVGEDGDDEPWQPCLAEAGPWASVPAFYADASYYRGEAAVLAGLEEDDELGVSLRDGLAAAAPVAPVHGINCYVFKQHDTPQIEAADALRGRPEDFMVLLRVASDGKTGFQFWDAGEIYFVIHKGDLARGDFSNVHCGLESS